MGGTGGSGHCGQTMGTGSLWLNHGHWVTVAKPWALGHCGQTMGTGSLWPNHGHWVTVAKPWALDHCGQTMGNIVPCHILIVSLFLCKHSPASVCHPSINTDIIIIIIIQLLPDINHLPQSYHSLPVCYNNNNIASNN